MGNNVLQDIIRNFIEQSKTNKLSTNLYPKEFNNFKVRISFGKGRVAKVPWIAFLSGRNKVMSGYYPAILLYKEVEKLFVVFGESERYNPKYNWKLNIEYPTIAKYFNLIESKKLKYSNCHIFSSYYINSLDLDKIENDIKVVLNIYETQIIEEL
jgi:5-methylcytosine-specific restriction enzyme B